MALNRLLGHGLKITLISWGFKHSKVDNTLFFSHSAEKVIFLLIYVDDIIVVSNKLNHLIDFTAKLNSIFALKDLGPLHIFLGIQVQRTASNFMLNQSQYILDLLLKFGMQNCSPCPTPLATNSSLTATDGTPLYNTTEYKKITWSS